MDLKKVFGKIGVRRKEEKGEGIGLEGLGEMDAEKGNVEEWWLKKEMREAKGVELEGKESEKIKGGEDIKRTVPFGPSDSRWISNLAADVTEVEGMDEQLRKAIEEVEGLGAKQILELAETTLREAEAKTKIGR